MRPILILYRQELDVSLVLNPKESWEYQHFIVIARWILELGRVDILYKLMLLSSYLDIPRKGHMEQLMGVFFYLDKS